MVSLTTAAPSQNVRMTPAAPCGYFEQAAGRLAVVVPGAWLSALEALERCGWQAASGSATARIATIRREGSIGRRLGCWTRNRLTRQGGGRRRALQVVAPA